MACLRRGAIRARCAGAGDPVVIGALRGEGRAPPSMLAQGAQCMWRTGLLGVWPPRRPSGEANEAPTMAKISSSMEQKAPASASGVPTAA